MNQAEKLMDKPDSEVREAVKDATQMSKDADSLHASYFRQEDGSVLVVTAWRGSDPLVRSFVSSDNIPSDLVRDHLSEEDQDKLTEENERRLAEAEEARNTASAEADEA